MVSRPAGLAALARERERSYHVRSMPDGRGFDSPQLHHVMSRDIPDCPSVNVAAVCRASCSRIVGTSAALTAVRHHRVTVSGCGAIPRASTNTRPLSVHAEPAARRSVACCLRQNVRTEMVWASRAITRDPARVFGAPVSMVVGSDNGCRMSILRGDREHGRSLLF